MMLLLDIGNTRLKWAWAGRDTWRAGTPLNLVPFPEAPPAEWAACRPDGVAAVSVAPAPLAQRVGHWAATLWGLEVEFVRTRAEAFGLRNGYRDPDCLGVDRWAALVGAHCSGAAPVCIVDCGTAVTVDLLGPGGRHHGGWIVPGRRLMEQALAHGTAGLGATSVSVSEAASFGQDTSACVANGTRAALAGFVSRALVEAMRICGEPVQCRVTGGDAGWLLPILPDDCRHEPELVLHGLAHIVGVQTCGAVR